MKPVLKSTAAVLFLILFIGCRGKEKKEEKKATVIPILSIIKNQVAHVDTSLYSISRIADIDSTRKDTSYIPREKFRETAKDFLSLPDLSSPAYEGRYAESDQFDETLNRVLIVYTPLAAEKEEIQRQEILIKPDEGAGDKVTNIIVNTIINTRDSLIEKRMLWKMDESFQVTTIKQFPGQPEKVSTYKVVWNESGY